MNFDDVAQGVQQGWDFVIPPTGRVMILAAVTFYVSPVVFDALIRKSATALSPELVSDQQIRAAMEFYGVSKLVPLAAIVVALALLQLFHRTFHLVASALPPFVTTVQPNLFLAAANEFQVVRLWQGNRKATNLNELRQLLETRFNELNAGERSNWTYWQKAAGLGGTRLGSVKVYIAAVLTATVLAFTLRLTDGHEVRRSLVALCVFAAAACYFIVQQLYGLMQQEYSLIQAMTIRPSSEHDPSAGSTDEFIKEFVHRVTPYESTAPKWWRLRFFETYMITWTAKHVVGGALTTRWSRRRSMR
jgi:hypothetical protein